MKQKVQITIHGVQKDDIGNMTDTRLTAAGEYYFRNGSHYLFYEEVSEESGEITPCVLKLKGDVLELTKKGAFPSKMIFQTGKQHKTAYATPFGVLPIETITTKLLFLEGENKLRIKLEYELWAQERELSKCKLTVKAEEQENRERKKEL